MIYILDLGYLKDQETTTSANLDRQYIKDVKVLILKFVDHIKVICAVDSEDKVQRFQEVMDQIYHWGQKNTLMFRLIRAGPNTQQKEDTSIFTPHYGHTFIGEELGRDLGIL